LQIYLLHIFPADGLSYNIDSGDDKEVIDFGTKKQSKQITFRPNRGRHRNFQTNNASNYEYLVQNISGILENLLDCYPEIDGAGFTHFKLPAASPSHMSDGSTGVGALTPPVEYMEWKGKERKEGVQEVGLRLPGRWRRRFISSYPSLHVVCVTWIHK
jgi:hypothetical protein